MHDETVEVLASEIKALSEGVEKLRSGRLNDKALLLLIEQATHPKVSKKKIRAVLDALEGLAAEYLKDETEK